MTVTMTMNRLTAVPVAALALLLAGCGGGGGGSLASTPTPSPAVTPAPAPPSTPVNASLAAPLKSETFNALSARATGTETSTTIRNATASLQGTASTISYDAATNTYVFTNPAASASGAAPDRLALVAAGPDCYATACTPTPSGAAGGSFMRRGVEGTNAYGFIYTYVAYANWHSDAAAGSDHAVTMNMAVFGATTPAGGVPVSGTASYKLDLRGFQMTGPLGTSAGRAILPSFSGTGTASVDFAAATYAMSGDMGGVLSQAVTTFSSSGKLSAGANGFAGNFSFADSGAFTGALQGWFFGPAAQELGAVFAATAPDGRTAVGTIVGHQ